MFLSCVITYKCDILPFISKLHLAWITFLKVGFKIYGWVNQTTETLTSL